MRLYPQGKIYPWTKLELPDSLFEVTEYNYKLGNNKVAVIGLEPEEFSKCVRILNARVQFGCCFDINTEFGPVVVARQELLID